MMARQRTQEWQLSKMGMGMMMNTVKPFAGPAVVSTTQASSGLDATFASGGSTANA